jgi:hypothetical protein
LLLLPAKSLSIRRAAPPFRKAQTTNSEVWYDLDFDADLITQSVAKQYKLLPSEQENIHYAEWLLLVSGIMGDTPLGQIVIIRKEKDPERIKCFTPYERRIHNEWRSFLAKTKLASGEKPEDYAKMFEAAFSKMFSNKSL